VAHVAKNHLLLFSNLDKVPEITFDEFESALAIYSLQGCYSILSFMAMSASNFSGTSDPAAVAILPSLSSTDNSFISF
jgi:hypothetical protein